MADFVSIPSCLLDEGLECRDVAVQIIFLHLEALQKGPGSFFFSCVPEPLDEVKDKVVPQPFIGWSDSSLIDFVGQMVGILMTPFINRVSFDVA